MEISLIFSLNDDFYRVPKNFDMISPVLVLMSHKLRPDIFFIANE